LLFAGYCVIAIVSPSAAADADHGKQIAERWCASCHSWSEDRQVPPIKRRPSLTWERPPEFDENKLAFLLLLP